MGLSPKFDDYPGGASCALCEDDIFNGKTPFFVEAWVFGIIQCPGPPADPPNGVFLLPQVDPCRWTLVSPPLIFDWFLAADRSVFQIASVPDRFWFFSQIFETCIDTFDNQHECGPPIILGDGGWVTIFWGPGIGL